MKKFIYLMPFVFILCQGDTKVVAQVRDAQVATSTKANANPKHYTFAAVNYSYTNYKGEKIKKVIVSDVVTTDDAMPEEDRYKLLDKLSDSPRVTIEKNSSVDKRETFTYETYAKASEKRQEILKTGIQ